jgi:hypothetical protein
MKNQEGIQQKNLVEKLRSNWETVREKLQEEYVDLDVHDLRPGNGKEEELISRIQTRTGMTREEFHDWVESRVLGQE